MLQLAAGNVSGLDELISSKCKGILGTVRDGTAKEKEIEEFKKLFAGFRPVSARNDAGVRVLSIRNADNATITFRVKKEGENFKVIEMTVKQPAAKKGR